jgi:hypothetical protein
VATLDDAEIKAQVERLEGARRDPALLATVPRVVAAQFGVVPIAAIDGGGIEVATVPGVTPHALYALERALRRRVVATPFDDGLVQLYVSRLYLKKETLNFHTFLEEDFLERDDALERLVLEKELEPVPPHVAPDPGRLALLDYAYRSVLESLDGRPWPLSFDEESLTDLAFAVDGPAEGGEAVTATIARAEDLEPAVFLLARESFSQGGLEHKHGWRSAEVSRLPFMIHPTELQITGIDPDGTLHLYIYDRVERVKPGDRPRFDVTYHFLSMGQRLRRRLTLKIYGLWTLARSAVRRTADPIPWSAGHLERWLGFDVV